MQKQILNILVCCFLVISSVAQLPQQYSFKHYGASEGLASNEAFSTAQDDQGYIWIATNNGLQRFDGIRFRTFKANKNDPYAIPANFIRDLIYDSNKNLWMLFGDGSVGRFDTRTFKYTQAKVTVSHKETLQAERGFYLDLEGNLFISFLGKEIVLWNEKEQEFSAAFNFLKVPPGGSMTFIAQQPGTKKYWMGTDNGLAVYDRSTDLLSYKDHNVGREVLIEKLGHISGPTRLLFDQKNRLWFDSWMGAPRIFLFDMKEGKVILDHYELKDITDGYHELRGFIEQKNGTMWIRGLPIFAKFNEKEKRFEKVANGYLSEQSIAYESVHHLLEDKEHNIWISTSNNGIYRFNPASQFFTNIRPVDPRTGRPGEGGIMSFVLTKDNTIFSSAWNQGLYEFDTNFNLLPIKYSGFDAINSHSKWSLVASQDSNTIWMGAQPGIFAMDQSSRTVKYYNPKVLENRTIRQVAEDLNGDLWIGTQSLGVFKWKGAAKRSNVEHSVRQHPGVPPKAQVLKLTRDPEGNIWVSTSGNGAYLIDPLTDRVMAHFGTKEVDGRKLNWDGVATVMQYDDTTMLIAANAIHFYSTKQKKIFRTINMPPSVPGLISAMERDKEGYLWISTTTGIFRVNLRNRIFIHFDRIDGIANDHFLNASSSVLPDGKILFGADNQFIFFDPASVKINNASPNVFITDFKLMNRSLLVDSLQNLDRIELAYKDNSITIDLAGLSYDGTFIIRYMLDGLDKDWITADNTSQAVYSYLPPGTYTFLAKTEDAEGNPGKNITKLIIKVRPPFWKTWWFLGIFILAITAILFWLDKLRMQRIRVTESIRTRIATSLTEDMTNSLSSINISSELAKTKMNTDKERTREYISQISETSNRMVQSMYDMVWSIDPNNDTMAGTIERMKTFSSEIDNMNFDFDIDRRVEKLELDMEHRYEMLSIFKEAVVNASRHSGGRNVKVSIRLNKSKLVMMILDDGKGFSMDDSAMLGRGISDMRRRVTGINASLYIESEINTGTVIKVEIPT